MARLIQITTLSCLLFSASLISTASHVHAGYVVKSFAAAKTNLDSSNGGQSDITDFGNLDYTIENTTDAGLVTPYSGDPNQIFPNHIESDLNNAALYLMGASSEGFIHIYFRLYADGLAPVSTQIDAIYLWNLNKGDSFRQGLYQNNGGPYLDGNGYLDEIFPDANPPYAGGSGVSKATFSYIDDPLATWASISDSTISWTSIPQFSFTQQTTDESVVEVKNFATPISANFIRLTIEQPFRQSKMVKRDENDEIVYGTNGIAELVDANLIGFSQIAYREYIPPAPPVVPEPGSVAVFGGLMVAGVWMRSRRRRSVTG
jgi:hypothetical protein